MIKLLRLDDRMIHGQVATKWSRLLTVDRILVANDAAASSPLMVKSLLMATPSTCKTAVKSMKDSINILLNPKAADHDFLVIVANPQDLLTIVESVPGINKVNIGNWGILEESDGKQRERYGSVCLSEDEKECVRKISEVIDDFYFQATPDAKALKASSIFK